MASEGSTEPHSVERQFGGNSSSEATSDFAHPSRLDAASYRRAAAAGGGPLQGTPVQAVWEPELTDAMQRLSVKVEEERVLEDLLADLASSH